MLMRFLWNLYGISMVLLSDVFAIAIIGFLWDFHDMSMMFLLDFYGVSMGFFGILMGLLRHPSGMSMMFVSDISLGFFWDFHGIIQGFL